MKALFFLALTVLPMTAQAGSLGVYGQLWPILEPDMVEQLKAEALAIQNDPHYAEKKKAVIDKAIWNLKHLPPVPGVGRVKKETVFYVDPSIVITKTITDNQGRIIAPAGTVINPFHFMHWTKSFIFIDAREPKQIAWMESIIKKEPMDKVILVGGSWYDLAQKEQRPIFFDQKGIFVKKFQINSVPTIVRQKGDKVEVDEKAI